MEAFLFQYSHLALSQSESPTEFNGFSLRRHRPNEPVFNNEVICMEWFLINVLSPLLLPIFLIAIIGLISDVKPDVFFKIYIDILQTVIVAIVRAVLQVAKVCFDFLFRFLSCIFQCICCSIQPKTSSRCKPCGTTDEKPAPEKKQPGRKPKSPKTPDEPR